MDLLRKEGRKALLEALRAACPETPDLIWVATPLRSKRWKLWRELLRSALDHSQLFAAVSWRQYILDHSQLFAALAFKDLLRRLGLPVAPFQRLRVRADCGTSITGKAGAMASSVSRDACFQEPGRPDPSLPGWSAGRHEVRRPASKTFLRNRAC